MKAFVYLFLSMMLFSGCAALKQRQEEKQAAKVAQWLREHPKEHATGCHESFPCRSGDTTISKGVDSSEYLRSLDELYQLLEQASWINDSMRQVLAENPDCVTRLQPIIEGYRMREREILRQVQNLKPLIETQYHYSTILDTAALVAARLELKEEKGKREKAEARLQQKEDKLDWYQGALLITWCVLALSVGLYIGRRLSNPLPK